MNKEQAMEFVRDNFREELRAAYHNSVGPQRDTVILFDTDWGTIRLAYAEPNQVWLPGPVLRLAYIGQWWSDDAEDEIMVDGEIDEMIDRQLDHQLADALQEVEAYYDRVEVNA